MKELLLLGVLLLQTPAAKPPASLITGRLTFFDGTPASGIVVVPIRVPEPGQQANFTGFPFRTDAMGVFRFTNLAPGRYYIRMGAQGEAFVYHPGVRTESEATVITVAAGTNITDLSFMLPLSESGVSVSGRVAIPPNQKAERVIINGDSRQVTGPIASDGTFDVPHVRRGRYTITVTPAPGMQPQPLLVVDNDVRGVELAVPRLTSIRGTVAMENAGTPPRFTIAVESAVYRTNVQVASDGNFTTQLPEAEYLLRLNGLPAGYYLESLASDKTDLVAKPLRVVTSDSPLPLNVTLGASAGVKVSGGVRIAGTNPAPSSVKSILLTGRAVNENVDSLLNDDGSFELPRVMPGAYFAKVTLASGLAAPLVPVVIPNKDVEDLVIGITDEVEVAGRIFVDGYGPPPRFSLLLIRGADPGLVPPRAGELPAVPPNIAGQLTRGAENLEGIQLAINALPDGSFKMKLPEGEYRVAAAPTTGANTPPPAYFLRSLTYGPADLLKEPMTVSPARTSELLIGFSTKEPNPWVKVSGRVRGADPAAGLLRVSIEGRTTAAIETPVNPDGSFEFLRVLQGTAYTARLVPANDAATAVPVNVADKDLTGIEIVIAPEKEIRIVATMEDGAMVPGFVMSLAASGSTVSVLVKPERDGAFRAKVPADERRVRIAGFPFGYVLKSASFGDTDLLKLPLRIGNDDKTELRVAFSADPAFPFGNLRGRLTGVDTAAASYRLALNGVTAFSSFETTVNPDGSFSFAKIPQGTYVPTLLGVTGLGLLSPSTVVVNSTDLFGIEINVPKQRLASSRPLFDESPTGVVVTNVAGTRESANERAAIVALRTINTAQVVYLSTNRGNYGTIADMIKAGLLDPSMANPRDGYSYSVIAVGSNYAAAAIPAQQGSSRYGFYALPDAVVRYSTLDVLSPPKQSGNPVQ